MDLSEHLKQNIEQSCLAILTHPMFMHYHSGTVQENYDNPAWQNEAIFFWQVDELFEKKSLPPQFKQFTKKYFILKNIPSSISLRKGNVMPWFGMPGGGDKFFFIENNAERSIASLVDREILEYIELIELNDDNDFVLQDRENYFFHMDMNVLQYQQDSFMHKGNKISIIEAYTSGGLKVIKK